MFGLGTCLYPSGAGTLQDIRVMLGAQGVALLAEVGQEGELATCFSLGRRVL